MQCPNCGEINTADAKFCARCAADLRVVAAGAPVQAPSHAMPQQQVAPKKANMVQIGGFALIGGAALLVICYLVGMVRGVLNTSPGFAFANVFGFLLAVVILAVLILVGILLISSLKKPSKENVLLAAGGIAGGIAVFGVLMAIDRLIFDMVYMFTFSGYNSADYVIDFFGSMFIFLIWAVILVACILILKQKVGKLK